MYPTHEIADHLLWSNRGTCLHREHPAIPRDVMGGGLTDTRTYTNLDAPSGAHLIGSSFHQSACGVGTHVCYSNLDFVGSAFNRHCTALLELSPLETLIWGLHHDEFIPFKDSNPEGARTYTGTLG